jgi:hypothetical protein
VDKTCKSTVRNAEIEWAQLCADNAMATCKMRAHSIVNSRKNPVSGGGVRRVSQHNQIIFMGFVYPKLRYGGSFPAMA